MPLLLLSAQINKKFMSVALTSEATQMKKIFQSC